MSFTRFLYYSAIISGWAAWLALLPAQVWILGNPRLTGMAQSVLTAALAGAALGVGLNLVSLAATGTWRHRQGRVVWGLLCGGTAGALGGWLGEWLYAQLGMPRALGWMVMGLGIGSAEGLFEGNWRKLRNGLIGGGLGGLGGGFLFDLATAALGGASTTGVAWGLALLGVTIGALIGLAHVVLKEAWLTVLEGFRPGRQLVLTRSITALGRADHLPLPFLGYPGRDIEPEHLLIRRTPQGVYTVEDNRSALGTALNGARLEQPAVLRDGDLLRFGSNIVRFNQRQRIGSRRLVPPSGEPAANAIPAPPPLPTVRPVPPAALRIPPPPPPPRRDRPGRTG